MDNTGHFWSTTNCVAVAFLALAASMGSGCSTVSSPPFNVRQKPPGLPCVRIAEETIRFGRGFGSDTRAYRAAFVRALPQQVLDSSASSSGELVVTDVLIDLAWRGGSGGEFLTGILSTIIPFVPLKRSVREARCEVSYIVAGPSRQPTVLHGNVRGTYKGWSLFRLWSLKNLKGREQLFAAGEAARLLADDLFAQYGSPPARRPGDATPVVMPAPGIGPVITRDPRIVPTPPDAPTCAILTFDAQTGLTPGEASLLTDRFATELERLGKYRLLNRSKTTELLRLAKDDLANCSSTECAIEAGKRLAVRYMFCGSLGKIGGVYTVNAYRVNVETGVSETTTTVDLRGNAEDLLTQGMRVVARRLVGLPDQEAQ